MSAPLFGKVTSPPNRVMVHYRITVYILTNIYWFVRNAQSTAESILRFLRNLSIPFSPPPPTPPSWTMDASQPKSKLKLETQSCSSAPHGVAQTSVRPPGRLRKTLPAKQNPRHRPEFWRTLSLSLSLSERTHVGKSGNAPSPPSKLPQKISPTL